MRSWEQYNIDKFYVYNLKKEVAIYKYQQIPCKYKTFLWKKYFVVFQDSMIFGKNAV